MGNYKMDYSSSKLSHLKLKHITKSEKYILLFSYDYLSDLIEHNRKQIVQKELQLLINLCEKSERNNKEF